MPAHKVQRGALKEGENGAFYRLNFGERDVPGNRAYLSKDGMKRPVDELKEILRESGVGLTVGTKGEVWNAASPRNEYGGKAPPGYGEHPEEDILWRTPDFRVHPITKRLEAINGLFFRLWPENVKILQQMKVEGWPHLEIVSVAQQLRVRQDEIFSRDERTAKKVLQAAEQKEDMEVDQMFGLAPPIPPGGMPPPPEGGPPGGMPSPSEGSPPGGMPPGGAPPMAMSFREDRGFDLEKGFTFVTGDFYRDKLKSFRDKFKKSKEKLKKTMFSGVSSETLRERARKDEEGFTIREAGVLGTPVEEDYVDEEEEK